MRNNKQIKVQNTTKINKPKDNKLQKGLFIFLGIIIGLYVAVGLSYAYINLIYLPNHASDSYSTLSAAAVFTMIVLPIAIAVCTTISVVIMGMVYKRVSARFRNLKRINTVAYIVLLALIAIPFAIVAIYSLIPNSARDNIVIVATESSSDNVKRDRTQILDLITREYPKANGVWIATKKSSEANVDDKVYNVLASVDMGGSEKTTFFFRVYKAKGFFSLVQSDTKTVRYEQNTMENPDKLSLAVKNAIINFTNEYHGLAIVTASYSDEGGGVTGLENGSYFFVQAVNVPELKVDVGTNNTSFLEYKYLFKIDENGGLTYIKDSVTMAVF